MVGARGQYRPRERVVDRRALLMLVILSAAPPSYAGGTDLLHEDTELNRWRYWVEKLSF